MKNLSTLFILSGALALTTASVALVACSSSPAPVKTGSDAGTTPGSDAAVNPGTDGAVNPGTDGGGGTDATTPVDTTCQPTLHIPKPDGGLYCPFSYDNATDSGIQYCNSPTQQCCLSPVNDAGLNSTCQPFADTCPSTDNLTFKVWQCSSPVDCVGAAVDGGGNPLVCCLLAGPALNPKTVDGGCTYTPTQGLDSTKCVAASACGQSVTVPNPTKPDASYTDLGFFACEEDKDCTAPGITGKTHCVAVKASGTAVGVCQ